MMNADQFMITSFVQKYWEIDQEIIGHLISMRNYLGDNIYQKNKDDGKITILGHPVELVGSKGVRMVYKFSDDSIHKVEVDMK